MCKSIKLRDMKISDIQEMQKAFKLQGSDKPLKVLENYYAEQEAGIRRVIIAEFEGQIAGYSTLLSSDPEGPFAGQNIPAICDFNVFVQFQRRGIGQAILNKVEEIAAKSCDRISLAVGLHSGYGPAQRLYAKAGYIPDGSGIWYRGKNLQAGEPCTNDDSLLLYLIKQQK